MTKLEIAKQELNGEELDFFGDNMGNLFDCMDVAAQQEAIAFAEWKDKEGYSLCSSGYIISKEHPSIGVQTMFTNTELYQIFKIQNNG